MIKKHILQENIDGLVPPQSIDLEELVLGACLLESEAFNEVADVLTPECFYFDAHKEIYIAMLDLYKKSHPIDMVTVTQKLKANNKLDLVGGGYFISSLTNRVASTSNLQYHSKLIVQFFLKREMIRLSRENITESYDTHSDIFDLYQKGVAKLESAVGGVIKYEVSDIGKVHSKVLNDSFAVAMNGTKSGIPTGYRNLDNFTNGWQKTDLVILAGRPSMGKSVCGLAFALNPALRDNIPTAIFSLEMSSDQLVGRCQSTLSGINSSKIIKKQLTIEECQIIELRCYELKRAPIYIDDTPSLSLMELKGKARKLVRDKKVRLIVIDYLQLMTAESSKSGNREQEVAFISKGLKALAKELDIPIIALSQLNRSVETRGNDKKPMLSDLRESGAIEQDADMVIFCYRPEYYGIQDYEVGGEIMATNGLMCLIVSKHRAGSLGELRFKFNGNLTKLENYDSIENEILQPSKLDENTGFLTQNLKEEEGDEMPF